MKLPNVAEALFSLKSFTASMLALYLALRIGLPRPFWAMLTAYVVSQPFSGSVRSKAAYRIGGTILGAAASVLLVPLLANSPELLTLALALWVGLCLYISLLDRTPRSYLFMLAGYTVALIGFPVVSEPATVFDVSIARVEEITLGIVCGTLVHSLVLPQSIGPVLLARMDHAIGDARRWISDVLHGGSDAQGTRDRRKLAADITELRLMSTHLPFDTSHLRWTSWTMRALQDRLAIMVPLLSSIEDRLRTLHQVDGPAVAPRWRALLDDIVEWSDDGRQDSARAAQLRDALGELAPVVHPGASWSELLKLNLAARLRALIDACEDCRNLRRDIDAGLHGALPADARRQSGLPPSVLHRDHRLASLSAFAAVIGISATCAFWIFTAWPAGSAAAMMAAVFCSFFATQDDPVPGIMVFLKYTLVSIPISALYLLVVLPAIHSFPMLVLSTAPVFLLLGIYVARPATTGRAMATLFGVAGMLSMQDTGSSDMVSFINSMLAQIGGIGAAAVTTALLRSVSAERTARRLLHAGWTEFARLARSDRMPSVAAVSARMLDRVSLLTPRLAMAGEQQDLVAVDALNDLRVGVNMIQLLHVRTGLEHRGISLQSLLDELSNYFRNRPLHHASDASPLLGCLDATLRAICAAPPLPGRNVAAVALVGIRRDLFPVAPPYQPENRYEEKNR